MRNPYRDYPTPKLIDNSFYCGNCNLIQSVKTTDFNHPRCMKCGNNIHRYGGKNEK